MDKKGVGIKMIFFDIDNTLIDYDTSEKKAIMELFKTKYDILLNDEQVQYWHTISKNILTDIYMVN